MLNMISQLSSNTYVTLCINKFLSEYKIFKIFETSVLYQMSFNRIRLSQWTYSVRLTYKVAFTLISKLNTCFKKEKPKALILKSMIFIINSDKF